MSPAPQQSLLQQSAEMPPGRRNGHGSHSLLPYLAQSLATRPSFHVSEQLPSDAAAEPELPARTTRPI